MTVRATVEIAVLTFLLGAWAAARWPKLAPRSAAGVGARLVAVYLAGLGFDHVHAGARATVLVGAAVLAFYWLVGCWVVQWAWSLLNGKGPDDGTPVRETA